MPDNNLPSWRQDLKSSRKKEGKSPSNRWIQLATVSEENEPRLRTVVFRGWHKDSSMIIFTDRRSEKIVHLKSNPKALGAKRVIPLEVAGAFHTEIVSSAKKPLEDTLNSIDISEGKIPVYMNVDAKKVEVSTLKESLVNQIDNSVLFNQQIEFVNNDIDPDLWCHIGPGNVTAGMVRKSISYKDLKVINSLESSK